MQIGELSTSPGVSAVGSLLEKLFLVELNVGAGHVLKLVRFSSGYVILNSLHI